MKKLIYFGSVGLTFLALMIGAVSYDLHRNLLAAQENVARCDEELIKSEINYIETLESLEIGPLELPSIAEYRLAKTREERVLSFETIITLSQPRVVSKLDINNPLSRRTADNLSGLANRHAIATKNCEVFTQQLKGRQ